MCYILQSLASVVQVIKGFPVSESFITTPHPASSMWSGPRIRRMLHYVPCVQRILYFFHGDATQLAAANNKQ